MLPCYYKNIVIILMCNSCGSILVTFIIGLIYACSNIQGLSSAVVEDYLLGVYSFLFFISVPVKNERMLYFPGNRNYRKLGKPENTFTRGNGKPQETGKYFYSWTGNSRKCQETIGNIKQHLWITMDNLEICSNIYTLSRNRLTKRFK